jgi:hypothetical protein
VVSASSDSGNAVFTIADMSPDTRVYAVQWVPQGEDFNSYEMMRATLKEITVPWLSCTRSYTLRVFVMAADWRLADGHQTQNVTAHSPTFDLTMPACAASGGGTSLSCAAGGTCAVGDTGPGGGIVFYVHAGGGTFTSTGSDCNTACRYLEAAPSDPSPVVWATTAPACYNAGGTSSTNACQADSVYSGNLFAQASSRLASEAFGMGMANTNQIYARLTTVGKAATADYAAGVAYAYTNNGKSDWHLPSYVELNELCKYARQQTTGNTNVACADSGSLRTGFSAAVYWSSSEYKFSEDRGDYVRFYDFSDGSWGIGPKTGSVRFRPVRAFG